MRSAPPEIFYTLLAGLATLTILLTFFVAAALRLHKQRVRELENLNLRETLRMEEERSRISRDLHDDFGSHISAMLMTNELLEERFPDNGLTSQLATQLRFSLTRLKQISHNLMPRIIEKEGLLAAIQELLFEIGISKKLATEFESTCDENGFVPDKTLIVYRIVQEIISNTIKHSGADRIKISCNSSEGKFMLDMRDNGKGFTCEEARKPGKSFGLQNIHARLQLLNAQYELRSPPGYGTHYHIEIPIVSLQTKIADTLAHAHEKHHTHLYHHS